MSLVALLFLFLSIGGNGKYVFHWLCRCTFHGYGTLVPISPTACVVLRREAATRTAQCVYKHSGIVSTAGLSLQNTQHCLAVLLLCYDTFTVQHKGENYVYGRGR